MIVTRLPRIAGWLALPLIAGLLAGCGGGLDTGYMLDLVYPLRKDPLVIAPLPPDEPAQPYAPGKLDENIRKFPEIKGKLLDPLALPEADRSALKSALDVAFGKPAQPLVRYYDVKTDDDDKADILAGVPGYMAKLKLDPSALTEGGKLFRRHCMQCHGVSGDGRGPSGAWLAPTPRDFRQGVFKFISCKPTLNRLRPRREDIRRTLVFGIEGTSMPSFALMSATELEQLTSYVLHLSLRGEVEYNTIRTILDPNQGRDSLENKNIGDHVNVQLGMTLWQWSEATTQPGATPTQPPVVEDPFADKEKFDISVRKGYGVFTGPDAGCVACHADFGRQSRYRFDDWGTLVRPNNLTAGVYRGGRRPIDIFYRLRCGIPGANMPKLGYLSQEERADPTNKKAGLTDAEVWSLVDFVRAVPFPEQLPADIRDRVYGKVAPADAKKTGGGHE